MQYRDLAGKMVPIYLVVCVSCYQEHHVLAERGKRITQEQAERWARADGWRKTKQGWCCPYCKERVRLAFRQDAT